MPFLRRIAARLVAPALVALALGGCLSGQTGSPDCAGARSCICDPLYGTGTLLRVHGESAQDGKLVAVVDQVFATVYGFPTDVQVGDRVGGSVMVEKPCAPADMAPTLVNTELFVLYFQGSADNRSAALLDGAFSFVVPWGEQLDFGASHRLANTEVNVLTTPERCLQRFPADPPPPCDDTRSFACSVAELNPQPPWPRGAALLSVLAVAALALARRRGASESRNRTARLPPTT